MRKKKEKPDPPLCHCVESCDGFGGEHSIGVEREWKLKREKTKDVDLTMKKILLTGFLFLSGWLMGQPVSLDQTVADILPVYEHLHANPELSLMEKNTSALLGEKLRTLGYEVIPNIGSYGLVGILKNGPGKVVMIRADMDALPVEEETGLAYASEVVMKNAGGQERPVMHACGHDMHMSAWLGAAQTMAQSLDDWQGTLIFLAQPGEEYGDGARKMIQGGLFDKIPLPDYVIALHVSPTLAAGKIGYTPGYSYSNVDAMEITVYGEGGHGAYPHTTIDPVVLASRIVLALQTLPSREFSPLEPLVVTVGAIHGGAKGNVIPNEVQLQLTLRYHNEDLRESLIEGIRRMCNGIALSAGLPEKKWPKLHYYPENLPGVYNDPELTQRLAGAFEAELGTAQVLKIPATMGGEDFGRFGTTEAQIPICIFTLGTISPQRAEAAARGEIQLPSLHSSKYAPDPQPSLRTGIQAMNAGIRELLK